MDTAARVWLRGAVAWDAATGFAPRFAKAAAAEGDTPRVDGLLVPMFLTP